MFMQFICMFMHLLFCIQLYADIDDHHCVVFEYVCLFPGVVPANGKIDIIVTFSPTEFNTAIMKLQVQICMHYHN